MQEQTVATGDAPEIVFGSVAGNLNLKAAARHLAAGIFLRVSRSNLNPRHRHDERQSAFFHDPKIPVS